MSILQPHVLYLYIDIERFTLAGVDMNDRAEAATDSGGTEVVRNDSPRLK